MASKSKDYHVYDQSEEDDDDELLYEDYEGYGDNNGEDKAKGKVRDRDEKERKKPKPGFFTRLFSSKGKNSDFEDDPALLYIAREVSQKSFEAEEEQRRRQQPASAQKRNPSDKIAMKQRSQSAPKQRSGTKEGVWKPPIANAKKDSIVEPPKPLDKQIMQNVSNNTCRFGGLFLTNYFFML